VEGELESAFKDEESAGFQLQKDSHNNTGQTFRANPAMADHEVIIKGEIHSSRGDLADERELLVEGVDSLILEGPSEDAEYGLLQSWYAFAILITEFLFFRILHTDTTVLEDIAKAQDAHVVKTRESDLSVLENSHVLARVGASALFLVLFLAAGIFGIVGNHLNGVTFMIGSVLVPVLLLRIHESKRATGSRDEKIANQIVKAAENGGRVIVVVGNGHLDSVYGHLPSWVSVDRKRPAYPWYSWRHVKDIFYPSFVFVSVLWVFYTIFVAYAQFVWTLS